MTFKNANEFTSNSYFHCKECRRLVSKLIVLNTDPKTSIVNEMLLMVDEHKSGEFIGIFRFQHNKIGEKFDVITQCGTCGNLVSKDSPKATMTFPRGNR